MKNYHFDNKQQVQQPTRATTRSGFDQLWHLEEEDSEEGDEELPEPLRHLELRNNQAEHQEHGGNHCQTTNQCDPEMDKLSIIKDSKFFIIHKLKSLKTSKTSLFINFDISLALNICSRVYPKLI